jgi:hypothetical protein
MPEKISQGYEIGLERIGTGEKGIQWTLHLEEKNWFNWKGWTHILHSLYGRKPV